MCVCVRVCVCFLVLPPLPLVIFEAVQAAGATEGKELTHVTRGAACMRQLFAILCSPSKCSRYTGVNTDVRACVRASVCVYVCVCVSVSLCVVEED